MMRRRPYNMICSDLPTTVEVAGKRWPINTATSVCLDCMELLQDADKEKDEGVKTLYILRTLYPTQPPASCATEAMDVAIGFLRGAPVLEYGKTNLPHSDEPVIYWGLDAGAIIASFRQAYGMDREAVRRMHWWEFLQLLWNLPSDTRMGQLFATRSHAIDPKTKGEQRLREGEIKKGARPKDERTKEEKKRDAMKALASAL